MSEDFKKDDYINLFSQSIENLRKTSFNLETGDLIGVGSSNLAKRTKRMRDLRLEKKALENERFKEESKLKKKVLNFLMLLFVGETAAIFILSFLEAFTSFDLDPWNFRILVGATITQVYLMLRIAVEHLFPKNSH